MEKYGRLFDQSILDIGDHDPYRSDGKAEYKEDKQGEMLYVHPECLKEEQQNLIYHGAAGKSGKEVHLDTARIIVSGGRGMKGEEGFALLERLAEKIGGEVACTRPCVDEDGCFQHSR